jgi:hypothetical protein
MAQTRTFRLTRMRALPEAGGETLAFQTEGVGRRSRALFFDPREVPAFEGETATVEAVRKPGGWAVHPAQRTLQRNVQRTARTHPTHWLPVVAGDGLVCCERPAGR